VWTDFLTIERRLASGVASSKKMRRFVGDGVAAVFETASID